MTARVLADALPFIQAYADKTVVIKYGGHAMENEEASLSFARDVVMLKQVTSFVEGGSRDSVTYHAYIHTCLINIYSTWRIELCALKLVRPMA